MQTVIEYFNINYQWLVPLIVGGITVPFIIYGLSKGVKKIISNRAKVKGNNANITQIGDVNIGDNTRDEI